MNTKDLWGDLPVGEKRRTPFTILKEQASLLTQKTNGVLEGHVEKSAEGGQIRVDLYIVAPFLNNYSFSVIRVVSPLTQYPAFLLDVAAGTGPFPVEDDRQLIELVRESLQSSVVRGVIANLLSVSKDDES